MAIKELITLEGAQEVKKTLADLGKSGEDFVKKLNSAGGSSSPQLQQLAEKMKQGAGANTEHARSVNSVREAYHLLHPVLQTAGIQISELRGFAVLASAGLTGLAAAAGAALVIALSKLSDQVDATKAKIDNLFNVPTGSTAGAIAFNQLETGAKRYGTTVDDLLPTIAEWNKAIIKTKQDTYDLYVVGRSLSEVLGPDMQAGANATQLFVAALRGSGSTAKEAADETKQFAIAMQAGTGITGDFVRNLNPTSGILKLLEQAFNKTGLSADKFAAFLDENPKSLLQLMVALNDLKPAIDKTFDEKKPTAFDDAIQKVKSSWSTFLSDIANSDFGVGFLNVIARMPEDAKAAWNAIKQDMTDLKNFVTDLWANATWDNMFNGIKAASQAVLNWLTDKWQSFINWLSGQTPAPAGGGGGAAPAFASGGLFRGRGGIDTNLAWLTDLEYIIRPAAVRKYGTRVFDWLNSLQMPVGAIPGFAEGGLNTINNSMVTITGGSGQRPFVLNLPGFGSFRGSIAAPDQVVDALSRASAFEQLAQGGRSPGWRR